MGWHLGLLSRVPALPLVSPEEREERTMKVFLSKLGKTEFWVVALTDVGLVAASLAGALPATWAATATSVSAVAYAISRGIAKNSQDNSAGPGTAKVVQVTQAPPAA
jgi:hypothetical protein